MPKFGIEKEVRVCDSCYAALQSGRQIRSGDEVFFLWWRVACLNNIQKIESSIDKKKQGLNEFNFYQPIDAQLISSSLGNDNKVLLRYLYDGKNVLIIIDSKNNKTETIIKLKKRKIAW